MGYFYFFHLSSPKLFNASRGVMAALAARHSLMEFPSAGGWMLKEGGENILSSPLGRSWHKSSSPELIQHSAFIGGIIWLRSSSSIEM